MNTLLIIVFLNGLTITPFNINIVCSDAHSEAQDAFVLSKKAYNSNSLDSLTYYTKKAMTNFDDAMAYANDCGCDDANTSADDGYTYSKKAYISITLEDGQNYAKKAMSAAEDVMTYADDCTEE